MVDYNYIKSVKKMKSSSSDDIVSYTVTRQDDSILSVPHATDNTDYQAVQAWAAIDGNTIAEAD